MGLSIQHQRMVRRLSAGAFQIIGLPDGDVSPVFPTRAQAEGWLERQLPRLKGMSARKARPCLRCSEVFDSEGPHNRMCAQCRCLGDDTQAYSFINPRRRTG